MPSFFIPGYVIRIRSRKSYFYMIIKIYGIILKLVGYGEIINPNIINREI